MEIAWIANPPWKTGASACSGQIEVGVRATEAGARQLQLERTEKSPSSQPQTVMYDLAGTARPEVVAFGNGPIDQSDATDLSKDQARHSQIECRIQGT